METRLAEARRALDLLRGFVRRTGTTGWVDRRADAQFRRALRAVLAIEDADGIETAGPLDDRLTALRQEAMAAGLLTTEAVCRIEDECTKAAA